MPRTNKVMIMEKGKEIYSKREMEGDGPTRKGQDEERLMKKGRQSFLGSMHTSPTTRGIYNGLQLEIGESVRFHHEKQKEIERWGTRPTVTVEETNPRNIPGCNHAVVGAVVEAVEGAVAASCSSVPPFSPSAEAL